MWPRATAEDFNCSFPKFQSADPPWYPLSFERTEKAELSVLGSAASAAAHEEPNGELPEGRDNNRDPFI
jgi:hypothetical protein